MPAKYYFAKIEAAASFFAFSQVGHYLLRLALMLKGAFTIHIRETTVPPMQKDFPN